MLESLFDELKRASDFSLDGNPRRFAELVEEIARSGDPAIVPRLLGFFDDQTSFPDAMFAIVHAVEQFDDTVYLTGLFSMIEETWAASPEWLMVLHYRILNSPDTMKRYREMVGRLSRRQKVALRDLLVRIKNNEPEFSVRCTVLIKAMSRFSFF
ncbi:MAG: hypothetical protein BWY76_00070 [bacterium ADurb.Bin429]|nr:MAG: hypothetical protein BWY76_00070 [bacterium ADurb.Bin429]